MCDSDPCRRRGCCRGVPLRSAAVAIAALWLVVTTCGGGEYSAGYSAGYSTGFDAAVAKGAGPGARTTFSNATDESPPTPLSLQQQMWCSVLGGVACPFRTGPCRATAGVPCAPDPDHAMALNLRHAMVPDVRPEAKLTWSDDAAVRTVAVAAPPSAPATEPSGKRPCPEENSLCVKLKDMNCAVESIAEQCPEMCGRCSIMPVSDKAARTHDTAHKTTPVSSGGRTPMPTPLHLDPIPELVHYSHGPNQPDMIGTWKKLNPSHRFKFWDDAAVEKLVGDYRPDLHIHFPELAMVEKADIFRYAAVHRLGGIWSDSDVVCSRAIASWHEPYRKEAGPIEKLQFVIGVEFETPEPPNRLNNSLQFVQWTFASAANNPMLDYVLDRVKLAINTFSKTKPKFLHEGGENATLLRTGPIVFTAAILEFTRLYGSPPGGDRSQLNHPLAMLPPSELEKQAGQHLRLGGMYKGKSFNISGLVLPVRAFGYHEAHKGVVRHKQDHLVEHKYAGTWREQKKKPAKKPPPPVPPGCFRWDDKNWQGDDCDGPNLKVTTCGCEDCSPCTSVAGPDGTPKGCFTWNDKDWQGDDCTGDLKETTCGCDECVKCGSTSKSTSAGVRKTVKGTSAGGHDDPPSGCYRWNNRNWHGGESCDGPNLMVTSCGCGECVECKIVKRSSAKAPDDAPPTKKASKKSPPLAASGCYRWNKKEWRGDENCDGPDLKDTACGCDECVKCKSTDGAPKGCYRWNEKEWQGDESCDGPNLKVTACGCHECVECPSTAK